MYKKHKSIKKAANFKHLKSEKLEEMICTGWDHIAKKSSEIIPPLKKKQLCQKAKQVRINSQILLLRGILPI